jgi:DegV family protein with EDD domain
VERIKIVTDSSADLPANVVNELGIVVVPIMVTFGERCYEDDKLSRDEFWRLAKSHATMPQTSQPPSGLFQQAFEQWIDQGYKIFCATLTGRHSGTYNSAWSAAQAFEDRVVVVDSLSLSWGHACQVVEAARLALQGATMDKILERVRALRQRTHVLILLDTLENVRRGGRLANVMPALDKVARFLQIKPIINLVDGEIRLLGVARSYQKGIERLKAEVQRLGPLEYLAVMHTRRQEVAERLADELAKLLHIPREQIAVGEAGVALSAQGGEGIVATIGVQAG